jgi:hypothetical protein
MIATSQQYRFVKPLSDKVLRLIIERQNNPTYSEWNTKQETTVLP